VRDTIIYHGIRGVNLRIRAFCGLLVLMLLPVPVSLSQEYYTPQNLVFNVYSNGVTDVDYDLETDPTRVTIEIPLFGAHIENLVIRDDEGFPLDSSFTDAGVRVDTLGATVINITYRTSSLTAKTELIWNFNASTPIPATVRLPLGALIFDISDIPTDLRTIEGRQHLTLNPGDLSIYYIINLPNIRDEAESEISDAEEYLSQIESQGIVIFEAETLLVQAREAFDQERYLEAKQLASQAAAKAEATIEKANTASEMIESAAGAIEKAREEGRTEGISEIEASLQNARDYYVEGRYTEAHNYASQAYEDASEAEAPKKMSLIPIVLGLAAGAVAVLFILRRSKGGLTLPRMPGRVEEEPPEEGREYDLDRIFREHDLLRLEEKEVIRFIASCGGEAFANEVRDRYDIPRSSAWRLFRRMTGEEILVEHKVGNQSLFKIHEKYLL
jgi:uncharacterized membrane protein